MIRSRRTTDHALAVTTGLSLLSLLATALLRLDLTASVLLATGAFTVVYVVGTAAAIRLLPRGTWARRGAVVSFVSVVALLLDEDLCIRCGLCVNRCPPGALSMVHAQEMSVGEPTHG